jgi:hypothetical protein
MSNTAELCARLLEHAAIHDRETSPYSPEQAAWAADLRDAAALIQAAPVVERADSATPVVERGAGNMSDNAAPVARACCAGCMALPERSRLGDGFLLAPAEQWRMPELRQEAVAGCAGRRTHRATGAQAINPQQVAD